MLHNAHEGPDGRWRWNYDRVRQWADSGDSGAGDGSGAADGAGADDANTPGPSFGPMWDMVDRLTMPVALWQGGRWSVVDEADVSEWMRRCPHSTHTVVEGAGHSVQGDRPLELAGLIEDLLARPV